MSNITSNTDDTIDSRDVIDRIEELEEELQLLQDSKDEIEGDISDCDGDDADYRKAELDEITQAIADWNKSWDGEDLASLRRLAEEGSSCSDDWEYGVQLIHDNYFERAMDEMVADCYDLPKDLPSWMIITYDYDVLRGDYSSIDFDGQTYWVR